MNRLKFAPAAKSTVISGDDLAKRLQILIGSSFNLTDKPRTNGASLRKMISMILDDGSVKTADKGSYTVVPYKGKGVPHLLACLSDSYIVTTGEVYNLQVWNRLPHSAHILIKYNNREKPIRCKDIRFIFVKIDSAKKRITSVVVATPEYIVKRFGTFGVPTIKYQMIVSDWKRRDILQSPNSCFFRTDTRSMSLHTTDMLSVPQCKFSDVPAEGEILSLESIRDKVVHSLIGTKLAVSDTKTKGQNLERIVANLLGYRMEDTLVGGYPDIPNQLLEVKVQDSPTVDLGKYSPGNPVTIDTEMGLTTEDIRYLIALTDSDGLIEGLILAPGASLVETFTLVSGTNYKCQRSIPMSFFDNHQGKAVFNP